MSDWQVGDLAVCVSVSHPMFSDNSRLLNVGTIYTVALVGRPLRVLNGERGLGFVEVAPTRRNRGYPETMFRKIRPDEHEACEQEFITLLKRSKTPAPAETASAWLLRIAPDAHRMVEEMKLENTREPEDSPNKRSGRNS